MVPFSAMRMPATERGRAVVERILASATEQIHKSGLHGVSLDDILDEAGVGRGQFYRYFDSRDDLVPLVFEREVDNWARRHASELARLAEPGGFAQLAESLVALSARTRLRRWCPVAALAVDVVRDPSPVAVAARRAAMRRMAEHLEVGLVAAQRGGMLDADADPHRLANTFLACFEGGLLVAVATGELAALEDALAAALLVFSSHGLS